MRGDRRRPAATGTRAPRLRLDAVACAGVGMCAYLAPDTVALDSWGFPVVPPEDLAPHQLRSARIAAAACPKRALHLTDTT